MKVQRKERRALPGPLEVLYGGKATAWSLWIAGVEYTAFVSRDNIGGDIPDERWHISISGEHDVPPWDVLVTIGHDLRPGVPFVVGVPPKSWWMNIASNCLHLMETKDENLVAQWRAERQGHAPT